MEQKAHNFKICYDLGNEMQDDVLAQPRFVSLYFLKVMCVLYIGRKIRFETFVVGVDI